MNAVCPDEEVLGRFVAGALQPSELDAMDRHLASCDECRLVVAGAAGAGEAPDHCLRPGLQVGRYRIVSVLGVGGMAVVYRARDPQLDRDVALKIVRPDHADVHPDLHARIIREAQAMARLAHPNVVPVHDVGELDGQVFLTMELVEGRNLRRWMAGPRTRAELLRALLDAGRGLAAAHAKGLVHRDFKPDNVLVGDDGRVRITDFGLASAGARHALPPEINSAMVSTRSGTIAGSPAYMAPEQIRGERIGPSTDLFAFCVTAWELLFGVRPFRGETLEELSAEIAGRRIQEGRSSTAPSGLRAALLKGLSADPARRPASMGELLDRLEREGRAPRPRWKWPAAAILAILAAGALLDSRGAGLPRGRTTVGVADFANQTGEDALGGLSAMFVTSLEQSRNISVLTRSRMFDILAQTGRHEPGRIDETLGREIARRAGAEALVVGSIGRFGGLYAIEVKLLEPERNEYIFAAREEARDWEQVPAMIDRLAARVRLALHDPGGERGSAEVAAASMARSLEAYRHYLVGEDMRDKGVGNPIPEFKRAIAIDPDFVLAHYQLAGILATEEARDATEPIAQAMRLIDRAPAKERIYIRALDARIRGDNAASISFYRELLASYPLEKQAHLQLGRLLFLSRKDDESAFDSFRRALRLDPGFANAWHSLIRSHWLRHDLPAAVSASAEYATAMPSEYSYFLLGYAQAATGHVAEANKAFGRIADLFPEAAAAHAGVAAMHLLREEWDAADAEYAKLLRSSRPDWLIGGYRGRSWVAASRGKYREAIRWLDEAVRVASRAGKGPEAATLRAAKALWLVRGWNDVESAEREIDLATAGIDPVVDATLEHKHAYWYAIAAELEAGRIDRAQALTDRSRPLFGENHSDEPLEAARLHRQGKDDEAEKVLESQVGFNWDSLIEAHLAEWHFQRGRIDAALEAATRFLATPPMAHPDVPGFRAATVPKIRLLIAACQEAKGDRAAAVRTLRDFVQAYAQADPDLRDLEEARARLTRLEPIGTR